MSLERKDVRFKLAPDMHAALSAMAEVAQVDIAEFVELIVQREVVRRAHDAMVISERIARLGLSGISRELSGTGSQRGDGRA